MLYSPVPVPTRLRDFQQVIVTLPPWYMFCMYLKRIGGTKCPLSPALDFLSIAWVLGSPHTSHLGFPGGSAGKESACNAGDLDSIPGLGRSPGEGKGYPPQYSDLENPHGQRSLAGHSPWRGKESGTTERLSTANEKSTLWPNQTQLDHVIHMCPSQPFFSQERKTSLGH